MRTLIKFGFAGIVALIGGGFALYTYFQTQANVVFIDNTHPVPVTVAVAGQTHELQPGQEAVVELDEGEHEVVATGPEGELTRGSVTVTGSSFRGIYDLAGTGHYMVVHATFNAAGGGTQYEELPPGSGFHQLPAGTVREGLDETIPTEMTSSSSSGSTTLIYACRFNPESETIGCPGA
ncbi:MAG: hypothetical protein AAGF12_19615 [Myxococcota bacterium]